jgi:hypothetical protein
MYMYTSKYTYICIDFEASSKVERDALAQGFTILMTRFKEKSPQEEINWGN